MACVRAFYVSFQIFISDVTFVRPIVIELRLLGSQRLFSDVYSTYDSEYHLEIDVPSTVSSSLCPVFDIFFLALPDNFSFCFDHLGPTKLYFHGQF